MEKIKPGGLFNHIGEKIESNELLQDTTLKVYSRSQLGFVEGQNLFYRYVEKYKVFSAALLFLFGVVFLYLGKHELGAYCLITLHLQMILNINTRGQQERSRSRVLE